jgi:dTDP-4-dehydrorhamnose reductase
MRILLFGANGQVGHELRRSLASLGELVCTTRSGMLPDGTRCEIADLAQPASLPGLVERIAPDVVVNAAAYTAVDRAEDDRDAAFRANAEAPAAIAATCARQGSLLVHYSTDYVFDGTATRPYREDDLTCPLGVYGASKLAGELAIQTSGARHMIFRTAWVYGGHGHNFLKTMLRLGGEREELRVVSDQIGTPTPAALIADVTAVALRAPSLPSDVWHLTATGNTSWCGFAEAIFARALATGLMARRPAVVPIQASEYPTPARRPAYSCLDVAKLQQDFDVALPEWKSALDTVLAGLPR